MAGSRTPGHPSGDAAVGSSVVAFLVAGVLFMASVVAVLVTTRTGSDFDATGDAPDAAASRIQASNLADLLLQSPGYSQGLPFGQGVVVGYDGKIGNADELTRLGLLDPDAPEPFMMDFAKFQNLRLAPLAAGNDDYVNYNETLRQLGLDGTGVNYHIRSYPSLKSTSEILANAGDRDDNLRVMYLANATAIHGQHDESSPDPAAGLSVAAPTCEVSADAPKAFRINTRITNGAAGVQTPTQFEVIFDLDFANGDSEYHKRNTFIIDDGDFADVFVDTAALPSSDNRAARSCNGLEYNIRVYDSVLRLHEVEGEFSNNPSPSATTVRSLLLDTSSEYYHEGEDVLVTYSGHEVVTSGNGQNTRVRVEDLPTGTLLTLTVCPGTTECRLGTDTTGHIYQITVPNQNNNRFVTIPAADLEDAAEETLANEFTLRLYDNPNGGAIETTAYRTLDRLVVTEGVDIDPFKPTTAVVVGGAGDYEVSDGVPIEVSFLEGLMGRFCPVWFDSADPTMSPYPPVAAAAPPLPARTSWSGGEDEYAERCSFKGAGEPVGDIYPQDKQTLKRELEDRLMYAESADHPDTDPSYISGGACPGTPNLDWTDIVVIGSDVDHNKLTSSDVKDCIGNWVLGGGTLIVFGSSEMSTHWLESVFHVAIESSSTGLSVPDQNHPVLNIPNDLNWPGYEHDYAWRLKVTGSFDAESAFTRVVNDQGTNPNAVLAVSDPGGFEAGSVILTGWTPWDLESDGNPSSNALAEGRNLVHNLLMMGYRDLYLDYGPTIPSKRTGADGTPLGLANVVPEIRNAQICHPEFDDEDTVACEDPIPLRFEIYVF